MTTSQKIMSIVSAVVALFLVLVKLYWPGLADPITQISIALVACLAAILAVIYPASNAVASIMRAHAAALAPKKRAKLPSKDESPLSLSDIMTWIYNQLDMNQIPYKTTDASGNVVYDPVPIAPRISERLNFFWESVDVSMAFKSDLFLAAKTICSNAFTKMTGQPAPTKWNDVANMNAYIATHLPQCSVQSAAFLTEALDPIRDVLCIQDTGDIVQ